MTIFKIHESYLIRHDILKSLYTYAQKEKDSQHPKNKISLMQIGMDKNIPFEKLLIYHELLHEEGDIICSYDCDTPNDHQLMLKTKGRQNFIYEKYLKDGLKERKDKIKDNVEIFSPLLTLVIALASLVISLLNYSITANQQDKINSLENSKIIKTDTIIGVNKVTADSRLTNQKQKVILQNIKKDTTHKVK